MKKSLFLIFSLALLVMQKLLAFKMEQEKQKKTVLYLCLLPSKEQPNHHGTLYVTESNQFETFSNESDGS